MAQKPSTNWTLHPHETGWWAAFPNDRVPRGRDRLDWLRQMEDDIDHLHDIDYRRDIYDKDGMRWVPIGRPDLPEVLNAS